MRNDPGRVAFLLRLLFALFGLMASAAVTHASTVATPVFSPVAGTYTSAQMVTMTSTTSGASINYTTDGSTPSATAGTVYSGPVSISTTTTLKAIAYETGFTNSVVKSETYTIKAIAPVFSPAAGTYTSPQMVTISSATSGASLAYTTDGTTPTESGGTVTNGTLYSGPISIGANTTLKAVAYEAGLTDSSVTSRTYSIKVIAPIFSPTGGTSTSPQSVTITTATSGASLAYTTDGSTPTESGGTVTNGTVYSGPISISANTTLKAIAYEAGLTDSAVTSGTYTIKVIAPVFSPVHGTYTSAQTVTITSATSGASINYTTDGSTPSPTTGNLYSGPLTLGSTTTLKAIAYDAGLTDSSVTSGTYTIKVIAPVFSPVHGTYTSAQTVTIASATSGASINYTTDGSTPSATNGTIYSSPVSISTSTTLKAIAYEAGLTNSTVTSGIYTITPPPVITSLLTTTGQVGTAFSYQITATNSPTSYNATGLASGLTVDTSTGLITGTPTTAGTSNITISASNPDGVGSATLVLTVNPEPVTFTISPVSFTYNGSAQGPTITPSISGATYSPSGTASATAAGAYTVMATATGNYTGTSGPIAWTIAQATPVVSWSPPSPIIYGTALDSTELNATANVPGSFVYTPSAGTVLNVGTQTLSVAFTPTDTTDFNNASASVSLEVDAEPVTFTISPVAFTYNGSAQGPTITPSISGATYSPSGTASATAAGSYSVTATATGNYTGTSGPIAWTIAQATPVVSWTAPAAITYGTALDSTELNATADVPGAFAYTPAAGTVPNVGTQTLSVAFTPTDTADYNNATATVSLTVNPPPPPLAPVFNPAGGTFTSAQSVTITSTGATSIYYTTDGSMPTTASTLYHAPVSIATTTTLQAIGINSGGSSPVGAASYTILPSIATLTFSPAAGTFTSAQIVTISTTTSGATIRYTTDGSAPTETNGTLYSGPVSIGSTTTLTAIAYENGFTDSPVTSGAYTINTSTPLPQITSFSLLYGFKGNKDGYSPSNLIQGADGRLYGTEQGGGDNYDGSVFAINPDGTNFTTIYSFTWANDGGGPQGGLIQGSDGRLYGTTQAAGVNGAGTVFAVNPDGTGFTVLHSFDRGSNNWTYTYASLVQGTDGRLYGTTYQGGANGYGTVYVVTTDGTSFATLYSFTNGTDGSYPQSSLIQGTDGRLYGTASRGGDSNGDGTVFAINTDGTNFTTLYSFTNGNDGSYSQSSLIQGIDGRLYGTASDGGVNNNNAGTVFALNLDGTNFTTLYSFTWGDDGGYPQAGLIQGSDGRLYGMAEYGGPDENGSVFVVNPDGTGFATLYDFTNGADGSYPQTNLYQGTDGRLYGSTYWGGANYDGTLFAISGLSSQSIIEGNSASLTVTDPGTIPLSYQWQFDGVNIDGATSPILTLTNVDASNSGSYTAVVSDLGGPVTSNALTLTVVPPPPSAPVFSPPAGAYSNSAPLPVSITSVGATTIYYTTDGSVPTISSTPYTAPVSIASDTVLKAVGLNSVGVTGPVASASFTFLPPTAAPILGPAAGTYASAQTVTINSATSGASIRYTTDGSTPTETSGTLYSGPFNLGSTTMLKAIAYETGFIDSPVTGGIYRIISPAPILNVMYNFTASSYPSALVQGSDGNFYGTTSRGGDNGYGTVFQVTPAGVLTTLVSFNGANGANPNGLVQGSDGNFYGTTGQGGSNNGGTAFKVTPAGILTTLGSIGGSPGAGLVQGSDGNFYGTTAFGGDFGGGSVFKMTPAGVVTTLGSFNPATDNWYYFYPNTSLVQGSDGNFYGTTYRGGDYNDGVAFEVTPDGVMTILFSFYSGFGASALVQGSDGNFYGTLYDGQYGSAFKMTPAGEFSPYLAFFNGAPPSGGLVLGSDGNFYGTTQQGGASNNGTVFQMTPDGLLTTVTSFDGANGAFPSGGLVQGSDGNFYGTTSSGGSSNQGVIFQAIVSPLSAVPMFSPSPGTYLSAQTVAITTATSGASIRYTTDGTTPTETNGTLYSGPVTISAAATTLQAIAYESGRADSSVASGFYGIVPPAPVFSPSAGTYADAQSVTITSPTATAIYYTTDGTYPSTSSTLYTVPVTIANNTSIVLQAVGVNSGGTGPVASANFTILPLPPVFSPPGGTYTNAQSVAITSAGATAIYYTTDGTTPTTASTHYTTPVVFIKNTVLKAFDVNIGGNSPVGTASYTILPSVPVFSPAPGTYATATVQSVVIDDVDGATIYYTTDGTTPTTASTQYTAPIQLPFGTTTLQAIAYKMGDNNSSVAGGAYMIMHPPSAAPVFSPGTGPYASAQMVTISTTTSGATIRYTTDGSIPTETTGNLYSGPLALGSTTTLKAIAYKSGFTDSPVTSGLYSFTQVAAPVFSSASGHAVMITTATGSATIRYTTDGSVPSETNGTIYTAPVTITAPTTLKAIAYETGFTDSPVTSSTIGIPTVTITTPANGSTINN